MLSAQMDGEEDPAVRPSLDKHLDSCADCRQWLDRAATVNRLASTGVTASVPDLTAAILAALPPAEQRPTQALPQSTSTRRPIMSARSGLRYGSARWWHKSALYAALAGTGAVQLILGLAQVGGGASTHVHGLEVTPGHLSHESAAWNVAVGASYLLLALRRSRPTGLVPMISAFVGMLLLLSVNDLTAGRVDAARLVSHGFVLLGFLLVVALSRSGADPGEPPGDRVAGGSAWRVYFDDTESGAGASGPKLRLVPRSEGPTTACHHRRPAA